MIYNDFIKCEVCDNMFNLRIQMGYYDIPFFIECPVCNVIIDGKVTIEPYDLLLNHAYKADYEDVEFNSVELSAEFPTRKMIIKRKEDLELTPFIRNMQFYVGGEESHKSIQKAMKYSEYLKQFGLNEFKQNFQLFWNNKYDILYPRLQKSLKDFPFTPIKKVSNRIDALVGIHQLFLTSTGISEVIIDDLNEYTKIAQELLTRPNNHPAILDFINDEKINFNKNEEKAFVLIELFSKIYEQLIPVVALRNANCLNNIDRNEYGIMTANFSELTDFYAKSYEWILDNISIILAMNNILMRNDYQVCENGKQYSDFISLSKGSRLQQNYIRFDDPLSKPISCLNNKIRNSIQHFDLEINYSSQKLIFKDRKRTEELYLIDFASLCIENFSLIFYLLEIIYNIRKVDFIAQGEVPSIISEVVGQNSPNNHHKVTSKKIGRNTPCPCGSGKKYKKCCL